MFNTLAQWIPMPLVQNILSGLQIATDAYFSVSVCGTLGACPCVQMKGILWHSVLAIFVSSVALASGFQIVMRQSEGVARGLKLTKSDWVYIEDYVK